MSKEFNIYLAGSMMGLTLEESNKWRKEATKKLYNLETDYKINTTNPNNFYNFVNKRHDSEEEIRRFDIRKVEQSNMILVNLNGKSIGTAMELQHAYDLNIPIIGYKDDGEELHPWLECVCDKLFTNLDDTIDYMEEFYLR